MTTDAPPQIVLRGRLDADEVARVTRLVDRAAQVDGVHPLSEHVSLHLRYGGDERVRNVLLYSDGRLAGYAHLDVTDQVAGSSAELVVDPDRRGHGLGRALVEELQRQTPDGRLRLWARGEHAGAAHLAASLGLTIARELWQMRRSLLTPLPTPHLPDGVLVRTFRPDVDDDAWVRLNAKAFATHPEQGGWTADDLHRRMREPWFDPEGFFLAERTIDGAPRLVGFHWTKVHGGHSHEAAAHAHHDHDHDRDHDHDHPHGHEPMGEVYVVGVDPDEQGHGLGKALTLLGLVHLRAAGLTEAMLYVDADNAPAIALYQRLGFTHWDTDRMYQRATT
jgi:mycothiol synthase